MEKNNAVKTAAGIDIEKSTQSVYNNNLVEVHGYVDSVPSLHHKTHDENIYEFTLKVPRLNPDTYDYLPIKISERVTRISGLKVGDKVKIEGQFRSFNKINKETNKTSLQLSIFVRNISKIETVGNTNVITLVGHLCKEPVYRITPSGREISDMILAVNRVYGRSDYIPCIAWSRNARFASNLKVGDAIIIEGRVQSRDYHKKLSDNTLEKHTVYEVSVFKIARNPADDRGEIIKTDEDIEE